MNVRKHISYIISILRLIDKSQQLLVKIFFDSDYVTSKKTIPESAKYSHYWEFLTVFWQEMIVKCQKMVEYFHKMTVFSQNNDRKN